MNGTATSVLAPFFPSLRCGRSASLWGYKGPSALPKNREVFGGPGVYYRPAKPRDYKVRKKSLTSGVWDSFE